MGSSKKQTIGYRYYIGMHNVLCHGPVDAITQIRVGGKVAYEPNVYQPISIYISKPSLFGGDQREGGVQGTIDLMFGEPTQEQNSYLQSQLGTDIPAYRGVCSVVYNQFYMGNNPYLKKWDFRVQRIMSAQDGVEQWYPEKAAIGSVTEAKNAFYYALDFSTSMSNFAPNGKTKFQNMVEAVVNSLEFIQQLLVGGSITNVSICCKLFTDEGFIQRNDATVSDIDDIITYLEAQTPGAFTGTSFANGFEAAPAFFTSGNNASYYKVMILATDGVPSGGQSDVDAAIAYRDQVPNNKTFGIQFDDNNPLTDDDTSFTQQVAKDNTVPVLESGDTSYVSNLFTEFITGHLDMNAVHIVRECLTNEDWGMGYLGADMNDTAFTEAADTIYDEKFGLSLLWTKQTPIEDFVKDVIRHIDGVLRVNIETGLFELKLIRNDYDEGTLPVLDESNIIKVEGLKRTQFGDLTNSVTVNFHDHLTGETGSVSTQDIALAQLQGDPINTTLEYNGISNKSIAMKAAARDLKALSSPLWTGNIYADTTAETLQIGDPFILNYPVNGVNNVVMRVSDIDYGDGKSNRVKIKFTQDVFATPVQPLVGVPLPEDGWQAPDLEAVPVENRNVTEATYYELVQDQGQDAVDDKLTSNNDVGYLSVSGVRPTDASTTATVSTDSGAGYENSNFMDFAPVAFLAEDITKTQKVIAIENGEDLEDVEIGDFAIIGDEYVRVDAISDSEITLGRAVMDTVPLEHSTGDAIIFADNFTTSDETEYVASDVVNVKLLTNTGSDSLDASAAPVDSVTMASRAFKPYPPGNVQLNAAYYPQTMGVADSTALTWAHRDRLQQTGGNFTDFEDGNIGPEASTTYSIDFYNELGVLVHQETGLTGTSFTWSVVDETADSGIVDESFGDPVFDSAVLVAHFNGADGSTTFVDDSDANQTLTANGAVELDTAITKFGSASLLFPGSNADFITIADSDDVTIADTEDRTLSAWVYVSTSAPTRAIILNKRDGSSAEEFTWWIEGGVCRWITFISGSADVDISSTTTIPDETWTHVEVTRESGTWRLFVGGNLEGTQAEGGTPTRNNSELKIGRSGFSSSRYFVGNMDEVIILKGYALHTSSFTPPTEELAPAASYRPNGKITYDIFSVRDGYESFYKNTHTVYRYGYGFNYGMFYGGV